MEFISSASSGDKLEKAVKEKGEQWTNLSNDAIDLLNICLDAKLKIENTEKGVGNVCKGIEELKEMCIARGKAEGKAEGEERLARLISMLYAEHRIQDISDVTLDKKKRAQLYTEYGIV